MASTILIIDDSPDLHVLVGARLRSFDVTLSHAYDPSSGLAKALESPPDLILLDVDMPGMSGFDVCKALRSDPCTKEIPILFLTGMHGSFTKSRGLVAGADDYITKPFKPEELRKRITAALADKALRDGQRAAIAVDSLTGLPPRARLDKALSERRPAGVTVIGLDGFRRVNERLGHAGADAILASIARSIAAGAGQEPVFRLGGDRFVVMHREDAKDTIIGRMDALRAGLSASLRRSVQGEGRSGASAGVALGDVPSGVLLRLAEGALAKAKSEGGDKLVTAGVVTEPGGPLSTRRPPPLK